MARTKQRCYFPMSNLCLTRPVLKYIHEEHSHLRITFPQGARKGEDVESEDEEDDDIDVLDISLSDIIDLPSLTPDS